MEPRQLADWIDRLGPGLVLFARQRCASAEDVVQEAFLALATLRTPPNDVRAWLYRVVRNGAISASRAESRRRRHETEAAVRRPDWFEDAPNLDAPAVADALESLDVEAREVIVAHLWGGLTFREIAVLLEISDSTANRRYLSGLAQLRERMEAPCPTRTSKPASER